MPSPLGSTTPNFDVPDVLIHCTTARAAKVWSFDNWRTVIDACTSKGLSVGLVGSRLKLSRTHTIQAAVKTT